MAKQMPPWLQEQLKRYQQTQVDLQNLIVQVERNEQDMLMTKAAINELKATPDTVNVYKAAGPVMVQSDRGKLLEELTERQELGKTATVVLEKQKTRLMNALKEQEARLNEATRGGAMKPPGS